MVYEELRNKAEEYYYDIAKESPFCAQFKVREFIASKIDLCEDRDQHLEILEWPEYRQKFAPMSRAEYASMRLKALNDFQDRLEKIEKEYNEKGVNSPDYHKI